MRNGGSCRIFGKPDVEHFKACLRALDVPRSKVAHVGDTLHMILLEQTPPTFSMCWWYQGSVDQSWFQVGSVSVWRQSHRPESTQRQQFSTTFGFSLLKIAERNPFCFAVLEFPDQNASCLCSILDWVSLCLPKRLLEADWWFDHCQACYLVCRGKRERINVSS